MINIRINCTPLFVLVALLLSPALFCQSYTQKKDLSKKLIKEFDSARSAFYQGRNDDAIRRIKALLAKEPQLIDGLLLLAEVYQSDLSKNEALKITYLSKSVQLDSFYNRHALFSLGESLIQQGEYLQGRQCMTSLKSQENYYRQYGDIVNQWIARSDFALERLKDKIDLEPIALLQFNTENPETFPTINAEEDQIFFGRIEQGQEDILFAKRGEEGWMPPVRLNFCTGQNESTQSISSDGKVIVFSACHRNDSYGSCDLYWSRKQGELWSEPENMGAIINSTAWESQPCLAEDGKVLYFSSNREGGIGGKDLYRSERAGDQWSEPQNLGSLINTEGNEGAPFLHFSGKELYFMSDGHPGMGKRDLYLARRNLGDWESVDHFPPPINSHLEEASLIANIQGNRAYYSREKESGSDRYRDMDLYQFDLPEEFRPTPSLYLKGLVLSQNGNVLSGAHIKIFDVRHAYEKTFVTDENGRFLLSIAGDQDYGIHVEKEGYVIHSEKLHLNKDSLSIENIQEWEVVLSPLSYAAFGAKSQEFVLENIFFETGSSALDTLSEAELERLLLFLKQNASLNIEIQGHTDDVGKAEDNMRLSQQRAEAVKNYLIEQGISGGRVSARGYGETRFIADNSTSQGRAKNRRTSFILK